MRERTVGYFWESDRGSYAVVLRWLPDVRCYTVVPEADGWTAWDVTR